jgi:hypothetical protein
MLLVHLIGGVLADGVEEDGDSIGSSTTSGRLWYGSGDSGSSAARSGGSSSH